MLPGSFCSRLAGPVLTACGLTLNLQLEELRLEQTKLNHEKVDLENQLEAEQVYLFCLQAWLNGSSRAAPALSLAPSCNLLKLHGIVSANFIGRIVIFYLRLLNHCRSTLSTSCRSSWSGWRQRKVPSRRRSVSSSAR